MVVLALIVVVLAVALVRLQHSLEALREELANVILKARTQPAPTTHLDALQRRVATLEATLRAHSLREPSEAVPPEAAAVGPPPAIEPELAAASSAPEPPRDDFSGKPLEPVGAEAHTPAPIEPPPSPEPAAVPAPVPVPVPVRVAEPAKAPPPAPMPSPAPPAPQEGWEVVVGTSWFNKIGVVVFVVGLALLLGYSMANVGPLGRVLMGYGLSLGMLGTGVVLERREAYRNYAYGLMGGGWAGVYFTTFAMHAVPAALVIESELVGALSLVVVAAGMIVHSLRYRSQTLTGLAYVSAYAPLAFSTLSTFSLAATVPLTASLLLVASRFAWSGVAILGIASTYAIFIFRTTVVADFPGATAALLVLWTYWLLFEIADIMAHLEARRSATATTKPTPLFALNAAGFLGAILLHTQGDASQWLLIGATAATYAASALVRARLSSDGTEPPDTTPETGFSTAHGATTIAAALFAYAIELRFSGTRQTVAWLFETQILVAAGIALADRQIRRIGTAVAVLTTLQAVATLLGDLPPGGFPSMLAASPSALLVAAVWYGNREWLRRRGLALDAVEHAYGWVALVLLIDVIAREVPNAYRGPAALAAAVILLEAGVRRASEYRYQSYVALAAASIMAGAAFFVDPLLNNRSNHFDRDVWISLPALIALAYGFAARLRRPGGDVANHKTEFAIAAAAASTIATGFLTVFEWHIAPIESVPAVWAATAAAATAFGAWRVGVVFRWQGYALAAFTALLPLAGLGLDQVDSRQEYVSTAAVIVFLFVVGYIGRTASAAPASLESFVAGFVAILGSGLQALFVWRVVPTDLVAPVWAVSAAALVVMGARRQRPSQRWQAYALVVIATLRTFVMFDVRVLDARLALASAAVVVLGYLVGYLGRALRPTPASDDIELLAAGLLSFGASFHLAALIEQLLPRSTEAAAWATAGVTLTALGVWRARAGQRWQGYAFFAASIAWMLRDLAFLVDRDLPTFWMGFSILAVYVTAIAIRPLLRAQSDGATRSAEEIARVGLLTAATVVLSSLLMNDVGTRLATLAWALQGAALLVVGFLARERVLRLSGLALLFLCILKLFAYDLQQLEALARILSFVVLGLVLLAVSWVYTRYREQIRKLL